AIEFERSGLHGYRARRCPRIRGLVDDPHRDAEACEPQSQNKTGWPRAGDEHTVGVLHTAFAVISLFRHSPGSRSSMHRTGTTKTGLFIRGDMMAPSRAV